MLKPLLSMARAINLQGVPDTNRAANEAVSTWPMPELETATGCSHRPSMTISAWRFALR